MPSSGSRARAAAAVPAALVLAVSLVHGLVTGSAQAVDDGTCVGRGEYKLVHGGMTIEKLNHVLHGQAPFAEIAGKGKKRIRWYAACEEWQPDKDVSVTYHQPVVGRRTVTKKKLDVYVAP